MIDETNRNEFPGDDRDRSGTASEVRVPAGGRRLTWLTHISRRRGMAVLVGGLVLAAVVLLYWTRVKPDNDSDEKKKPESAAREANEVSVSPEALSTMGIEIEGVTERPAIAPLKFTGAVEANAEREQMVVPLISGRVAAVYAALGQRVARGSVLATIESQQIAELRGQLLEVKSKLALATANLERVRQSSNRASVISAKAKLDLAEKTLDRQRRLLELGAGSLKEVQAAEAEYKTAKAEYDFQSNIALSREVQVAENEREAARVTAERLHQALLALGANPDSAKANAIVPVTSPVSGTVIKRAVNAGAGVKEGDQLFTIADISTVWVIANVPESEVNSLHLGMPAEVKSAGLGEDSLSGRLTFSDPQLNEETRTARVRVEVPNPSERLKVGMFVEVAFQTGTSAGNEFVVREEAIQRIGDRTVVFVPEENEPGHFQVRDVKAGGVGEGYRRIISGLTLGERVVTKGSFTLKSQLLKGTFGEEQY